MEKDADEYKMDHKKRGKAIILNHEHFERDESRDGTMKDVEKISKTMEVLGFEVEVHNDLDYSNILMLLKESMSQCVVQFGQKLVVVGKIVIKILDEDRQ